MSSPFAPPATFDGPELPGIVGGELRGTIRRGPWRVTTDSRLAGEDRLFIALRGDRFDGHDFVRKVLDSVTTGAVVAADHPAARFEPPPGCFLIAVDEPLHALGALAAHVRATASVPVIGLTGSSGKTTTKEMIAAVMGEGGAGLATEGNLNNEIGLPLTLLRWRDDLRWMALEMGMSAAGEIRRMAAIARPTIRLITNVAPAHLENFADLEAVAAAKGELFEDARPGDLLVSNADDPLAAVFPRPEGAREIRFGSNPTADVRVVKVEPLGAYGHRIWLSMIGQELCVELPLPGRHNIENVAAAAAVAGAAGVPLGPNARGRAPRRLPGRQNIDTGGGAGAVAWAAGVPMDSIAGGLARVRLPAGRMAALTLGDVLVFDDSYNANPRSVKAALRTLAGGPREGSAHGGAGRRMAVLGDMLELGPTGPELHRDVGRVAAELRVDRLVAVGPLGWFAMEGALAAGMPAECAIWREDASEVIDVLRDDLRPGDRVLVKGSRGMRMERVVAALKEELGC